MLDAFWQSIVIFFVVFACYYDSNISLWEFGTIITSALIICNQGQLMLMSHSWNWFLIVTVAVSILIFYGFALIYNLIAWDWPEPDPPYFVAEMVFSSANYWFSLLLITVLALLPR